MHEPEKGAFETLQSQERAGTRFEVLQYPALRGSADLAVAEKIFPLNQARIRLKMVRVTLDKAEALIEPGALYFMRGPLRLESGLAGGLAKSLPRKFAAGETLFQSTVGGTGEVYLEPGFGHRALFDLDRDAPVFDRGAFCCASAGIAVSARLQKSLSGALFGGEGIFQAAAEGSGVRVLKSPVPAGAGLRAAGFRAGRRREAGGGRQFRLRPLRERPVSGREVGQILVANRDRRRAAAANLHRAGAGVARADPRGVPKGCTIGSPARAGKPGWTRPTTAGGRRFERAFDLG